MSHNYQVVIDISQYNRGNAGAILKAAESEYGRILAGDLEANEGYLKFEGSFANAAPWETERVAHAIMQANGGKCHLKFWWYDLESPFRTEEYDEIPTVARLVNCPQP
jgi:hypothetical protein